MKRQASVHDCVRESVDTTQWRAGLRYSGLSDSYHVVVRRTSWTIATESTRSLHELMSELLATRVDPSGCESQHHAPFTRRREGVGILTIVPHHALEESKAGVFLEARVGPHLERAILILGIDDEERRLRTLQQVSVLLAASQ